MPKWRHRTAAQEKAGERSQAGKAWAGRKLLAACVLGRERGTALTMRILHILHQYLPDHVGGVEHHARALAVAQRQAGHQVAIFCRRSQAGRRLERDIQDGLPVYRAVGGRFTPAGRFRATLGDRYLSSSLRRVIGEMAPDVLHVHHLMGLPVSSLSDEELPGPLVVTLHDYWWVCANANLFTDYGRQVCAGPQGWLNCARCGLARAGAGVAWPLSPLAVPLFAARAVLLRRLQSRVAAWIAPTGFVADWHVAHGFPAARLHVVGHGIELPPEGLRPTPGREGTGEPLHLAYLGGLAPLKGVHLLIEAFNVLPPGMRLTVAGDESAFPDYCARLHRLATHPGIRFAGRLDRRDVWQLLSGVDALVVPSLWYETAALVIQEAFAVGTPVLASNHGALAERVRHEVDGLLVAPGQVLPLREAIRRLVDEPGLLHQLRRGIGPVTTMAENAARVEAIYRSLLDLPSEYGTM
jgi:glycosyltransferase involved in cell wall biosynthesis